MNGLEKMYQATVTTRYLKDKDVLRLLTPLFIWMVLFFVLFFIMCTTDISILVLPLFLEFLCIIPVAVRSVKNAGRFHRASVVKLDVVLTARDGMLYKDNIKLDAAYSKRDQEIYLENTHDAGKYNRRLTTFWGTISGEEVEGFLAFCRENGIELEMLTG